MNKFLFSIPLALALMPLAQANDFTFAQAGVKISAGNDMQLLARKDIDLLYPPTRGPGFVIGNAARSVTVSYDLKPSDLTGVDLSQVLKPFERVFEERVPALVWKERKVMEHEKQAWLQLEFISRAGGIDYYNIMLITPVKGQMLVLNLNSTVAEFAKAEPQLRAIQKSIVLNVVPAAIVAPPAPAKKAAAKPKKEAPAH